MLFLCQPQFAMWSHSLKMALLLLAVLAAAAATAAAAPQQAEETEEPREVVIRQRYIFKKLLPCERATYSSTVMVEKGSENGPSL